MQRTCDFRARAGRGAAAASIALGLFWGSAAAAQAVPDASDASAESAAEDNSTIIVTGSRIARSTFDTPSPVTVLGAEQLEQTQVTNVGEAVSDIPAFRPSNNPSTNGFGSFNVGAQIVNLRGLGVTRNLVLVDGRRFAPTTREGSVDLNFVPSTLVSRIEVVTGGASAAYGSDAIAGVVNVILDTKLNGFKAQADYGFSGEGDGKNLHGGIAWGGNLGDAGHLVIGGEYSDQKGVGNCFTRDWCKVGAVVTNVGYAANNGLPNYVRSDDNAGWFFNPSGVVSRLNNGSGLGNVIANSLGTGAITFGSNGTVSAYRAGTPAAGLSQVGGDLYPTYTDVDLIAPVERYTGFAHLDWDLGDNLRLFAEGSYGHVDGATYQAAYFSSTIPIYADNPYIPASVRTVAGFPAPAQPTAPASLSRPAAATFNLGRIFDDLARGYSRSKADTYRFTTGLSGDLDGGYSWDVYYQYGRTDRLQTVDNNLVVGAAAFSVNNPATIAQSNARFFFAADAVVNPANGQVTCRALLSPDPDLRAAAAGCVPINLFGAGNVGEAGKSYIYDQLREDINLEQHVIAGTFRGEAGDILGAPLSFATGAEYRVDKIDVKHDPLSNLYAYFQNFGSDYDGKTEVFEAFAELELPVADIFTLNGALRQAFYKTSGFGSYLRASRSNSFDATTWKISANFEPTDWLRVRATQSRDIRAPNFAELFLASASAFTPVTNRFGAAPSTNFPSIVSGGSIDLNPEKADTTTIGLILQPRGALDGLQFSVDGYRIKIKDFIGTAPGGAQFLVDKCVAGFAQACNYVTRNAAGAITEVRNTSLNLDYILARGIDFEASYRLPMGENSLQLRALATYVDKLETASLGDVIDRAGQTGSSAGLAAPDWTAHRFGYFHRAALPGHPAGPLHRAGSL